MRLSVIILNYNVRYFLEQCVGSVLKAIANLDAEIIVVDNNSPDDSCEMMREKFPDVTLIAHPENAGFPKGNNIGVAAAKGEFICILNPDTVVAEDTFEKVLSYYDSLENPGIIGVQLVDGRGQFLPESKRGTPTPFVALTKIAGLHKLSPRFFGKYYASHLSKEESGKVDILVGAFMLMKRALYLDVGGFDEDCFMYSDDIDLSYTVLKSGRSNYYYHGTAVIHYKGESTAKDKMYIKRFSDAMNFFYKKHFRRSFLFDFFLKTGAYIFLKSKAKTTEIRRKIDRFLLISDDESLKSAISKSFGIETERITAAATIAQLGGRTNTEIIFDSEHIDYKSVIENMISLSNSDATFKIAHKKSGFLIGSNSSNDRGEVLKIADYR